MKILGIDYGTKNIGLALSDDEANFAFPYTTINNQQSTINNIKEICEKEKVEKIIIGLPINLDGQETDTTQKVKKFILKLKANLDLPIETIDERLSTVQAHKLGANKKSANIDEVSAQILLQNWIDRR